MKHILIIFLFLLSIQSNNAQKYNFSAIDKYAIETSKKYEKSIESLASYLIKPAKNDLEKVRSIYVWVCKNIKYDTYSFFNDRNLQLTPIEVVKRKKAVCQGYSELFKALCDIAEVKCFVISGYSKGYGFSPFRNFNQSDHAWNSVLINKKWHLIDATWGSGYLNDKKNFVKRFTNMFFLSEPKSFVLKHLPSDPMWQLLDCPIQINDFKKDSVKIKEKLKIEKCEFCFMDSINSYLKLNKDERVLKTAINSYNFNPKNTTDIGFAYLNYAYYLSHDIKNPENQEEIELFIRKQKELLKYNNIAKNYLTKSKSSQAKNALKICKENIKVIKSNLKIVD